MAMMIDEHEAVSGDSSTHLICACTGSFFATATYENFADFEVFPLSDEPIWILGMKYSLVRGKHHFLQGC